MSASARRRTQKSSRLRMANRNTMTQSSSFGGYAPKRGISSGGTLRRIKEAFFAKMIGGSGSRGE